MRKLAITLLLMHNYFSFSQSITIDIKANYFINNSTTFVMHENGEYIAKSLKLDYNRQTDKYSISLVNDRSYDIAKMGTKAAKYTLTPFSDIKKGTTIQLLTSLKDVEFTFAKEQDRRGTETYGKLNFTGDYVIYRNYKKLANESEFKSETDQNGFLDIVPVTVNNTITILFFCRYSLVRGYIIPLKKGYSLKYFMNSKIPVTGLVTDNKELKDIIHNGYPSGQIFKAKGKTGVREKISKNVILPAVYDSVKLSGSYLITAYNNSHPSLFFNNGDSIAIPKLKAVYITPQSTYAITGNALKRVDKNGKLTNTPPDALYAECGSVPQITNTIEVKYGAYTFVEVYEYGNKIVKRYKIAPQNYYKSLTFLNQEITHRYMLMGSANYSLPAYCFIFETPDGKKGIVKIDYTQPLPVQEVMLAADKYIFEGEYFNHPVRFIKKGLIGYWPQNKQVKYSEITRFDKGFARFTLSNGKKGWLALNGNEYLDD